METYPKKETKIVETTIGDLIEVLTSVAMRKSLSEKESYTLASIALGKILAENGKKIPNLIY